MPSYGNATPTSGTPAGAAPAGNKAYRPDVGSYLTDAEYAAHQQNLPLTQLKASTGIQTGATNDIASHAAQLQSSQADQAARLAQSQLMAQTAAQQGLASQAAGFESQHLGETAGYASQAAKEKAGYDTSAMTLQQSLAQKQSAAEAALQAQAETRRIEEVPQLLQGLGIGGAGGVGGAGVGGVPPPINQANITGEDAARNAAFNRAKDTAGSTGRSAMSALENVMGARGLTGSPYSAGQAGGVIQAGASQLGDVNREQLIQDLAAARQRASEQYQGQIAQRGQDIATRGQNIGLASPLLALLGARY